MLRRDGYLQPVLLQVLGVLMLVGFVIFWAVTGQQSSLLVGAALVLIGVGSAQGAIISVRQDITQLPPPPPYEDQDRRMTDRERRRDGHGDGQFRA